MTLRAAILVGEGLWNEEYIQKLKKEIRDLGLEDFIMVFGDTKTPIDKVMKNFLATTKGKTAKNLLIICNAHGVMDKGKHHLDNFDLRTSDVLNAPHILGHPVSELLLSCRGSGALEGDHGIMDGIEVLANSESDQVALAVVNKKIIHTVIGMISKDKQISNSEIFAEVIGKQETFFHKAAGTKEVTKYYTADRFDLKKIKTLLSKTFDKFHKSASLPDRIISKTLSAFKESGEEYFNIDNVKFVLNTILKELIEQEETSVEEDEALDEFYDEFIDALTTNLVSKVKKESLEKDSKERKERFRGEEKDDDKKSSNSGQKQSDLLVGFITSNNKEGIEAVIKSRIDINAPIIYGDRSLTPLIIACSIPAIRPDIITMLLEKKADVNIATHHLTPLVATIYRAENLSIMQILIDAGADVNKVCDDGEDALEVATNKGNLDAALLLVKNGANILRKFNYGENFLTRINKSPDSPTKKILTDLYRSAHEINNIFLKTKKRGLEKKDMGKIIAEVTKNNENSRTFDYIDSPKNRSLLTRCLLHCRAETATALGESLELFMTPKNLFLPDNKNRLPLQIARDRALKNKAFIPIFEKLLLEMQRLNPEWEIPKHFLPPKSFFTSQASYDAIKAILYRPQERALSEKDFDRKETKEEKKQKHAVLHIPPKEAESAVGIRSVSRLGRGRSGGSDRGRSDSDS